MRRKIRANGSVFAVIIALLLLLPGCKEEPEVEQQQKSYSDIAVGELMQKPEAEQQQKDYSDITADELMQKIERGERFTLLDVRTPDEYSRGYIKGAILIPHTKIEARRGKLGCSCREIVVYCKVGRRSATAAKVLVKMGFGRVKNLAGGILEWEKAGGELIKED